MQSWHFEGKAAEEMFRQEQREQEDREKKRAEKDKPFGLLARMKASGWEPGQQLPAVDGIESDHTIDFTVIPIAKPLEWLFKPLVGLVRAQWLGRAAARAASKIEGNASRHTFPQSLLLNYNIINQLNNWLLRYEDEHYNGLKDDSNIDKLDRDGIQLAIATRADLGNAKIEYFSAARLVMSVI